jgi:hypothetical protein
LFAVCCPYSTGWPWLLSSELKVAESIPKLGRGGRIRTVLFPQDTVTHYLYGANAAIYLDRGAEDILGNETDRDIESEEYKDLDPHRDHMLPHFFLRQFHVVSTLFWLGSSESNRANHCLTGRSLHLAWLDPNKFARAYL